MFRGLGKVAPGIRHHSGQLKHWRKWPFLGNHAIVFQNVGEDGRFDLKLPHREKADIARSKLTDYLLSKTHPVGRWKRKLFTSIGFDETNVDSLETGLLFIAESGEVREAIYSAYGTKYIIDGKLQGPSGGIMSVRTVWMIEEGQDTPRFVTAYPL
jgi:hypothetical protein